MARVIFDEAGYVDAEWAGVIAEQIDGRCADLRILSVDRAQVDEIADWLREGDFRPNEEINLDMLAAEWREYQEAAQN